MTIKTSKQLWYCTTTFECTRVSACVRSIEDNDHADSEMVNRRPEFPSHVLIENVAGGMALMIPDILLVLLILKRNKSANGDSLDHYTKLQVKPKDGSVSL
mmetsp:Transcript_6796/g.7880  ORF Transcript_6796/g.7880 Transcript_6796/m.7880 type:complete len:101 (-) Transcript_6796:137-439(-)